jgi:hypothetical protein
MTFHELYNKLNKLDIITEDPDNAYVSITTPDGITINKKCDYDDNNAVTFITFKDAIFYTTACYHGRLMSVIHHQYLLRDDPCTYVHAIGEISEEDRQEYIEQFKDVEGYYRGSTLEKHPDAIQGRIWIDKNICIVAMWNKIGNIKPKDVFLIKQMVQKHKADPDNIYLELGNDKSSVNLNDLYKSKEPFPEHDFDLDKIHLTSPEVKKQMLLKQGARPKAPLDIRQKQQRLQGD